GYEIISADSSPLVAVAGDAKRLTLVRTMSDGTTAPLSPGETVSWSGPPAIAALPTGSAPDQSILPTPAATATAMWLDDPEHYSADQLQGVLWILDSGTAPNQTVEVTAIPSSANTPTTAVIDIAPNPAGDVTRGQSIYAVNCASCHGATG